MNVTATLKLFTPHTMGEDLVLKNRIVLSPLTRARCDKETREPSELNQIYYEQRAGAGLLITEATGISEQGFGWYGAPALYTEAHAAAWKKITDRVHEKGGRIFVQLWHLGRQSHPTFLHEVVAPSAIRIPEPKVHNSKGELVPFETPRALDLEEIPGLINDYRKSAALAKDAGFDGVEIHAANGYLVDTFLQSSTNTRTGKYGGSIENRARFLLEIIEAINKEWPSDRIGLRLSPNGGFAGMGSADNYEQFVYTAAQLDKHNLAYIAILDGVGFGYHDKGRLVTAFDIKKVFNGTVIATNSYTRDIAEGAVRSGAADLVSFGRLYISNPDLAERFQNDWPLNPEALLADYKDSNKGAEGYITFPAYFTLNRG